MRQKMKKSKTLLEVVDVAVVVDDDEDDDVEDK